MLNGLFTGTISATHIKFCLRIVPAVFCLAVVACVPFSRTAPQDEEIGPHLFLSAAPPSSLSGDMALGLPGDIEEEMSIASNSPEILVGDYSLCISEPCDDVEIAEVFPDFSEVESSGSVDAVESTPNVPVAEPSPKGDAAAVCPEEKTSKDVMVAKATPEAEHSNLESAEPVPDIPAAVTQSGAKEEIPIPAPGSAEEKRLAALHTKQSLCKGSATLCVTSPYGVKRSGKRVHQGIDIRAPLGSPIMAFRGGTVVKSEFHHSYGNIIEIQQDNGLLARYAHMSQRIARKGDHVQPGVMIGRVGSTGRSTGPHLHFELLRGNRQMNPLILLPTPNQVVVKATPADVEAVRKASAAQKAAKRKSPAKKAPAQTKKASTATAAKKAPAASKATAVATQKKAPAQAKKASTATAAKKTPVTSKATAAATAKTSSGNAKASASAGTSKTANANTAVAAKKTAGTNTASSAAKKSS